MFVTDSSKCDAFFAELTCVQLAQCAAIFCDRQSFHLFPSTARLFDQLDAGSAPGASVGADEKLELRLSTCDTLALADCLCPDGLVLQAANGVEFPQLRKPALRRLAGERLSGDDDLRAGPATAAVALADADDGHGEEADERPAKRARREASQPSAAAETKTLSTVHGSASGSAARLPVTAPPTSACRRSTARKTA